MITNDELQPLTQMHLKALLEHLYTKYNTTYRQGHSRTCALHAVTVKDMLKEQTEDDRSDHKTLIHWN